MNQYEIIVIGGGPAGYVGAIRAAQKGYKTVCISPDLGGTCLQEGCIPSKFLLNTSHHYDFIKNHAGEFGIEVKETSFDLPKIIKKKTAIIRTLEGGIKHLLDKNKAEYIKQKAKLLDNKIVELEDGTKIQATKAVILAVGSKIFEVEFKGNDKTRIDNSRTALNWEKVPENLLVVGAGYIGLELASVWKRFGANVTVVDMSEKFLPFLDQDVSDTVRKSLEKTGIELKLGVTIKEYKAGEKIEVELTDGSKIVVDRVLSAIGRKAVDPIWPNVIKMDKGFVQVNENYETSSNGVFAVGDLTGGALLAHRASDQAWCVIEHLYKTNPPVQSNKLDVCVPKVENVPSVIYLEPEVAVVGATEQELKEKGIAYKVFKMPIQSNGRAVTMNEKVGFVKVLCSEKDQIVLGACAVGKNAESMICQVAVGMSFKATTHDFATVCYPHPSVDEVLRETMFAGSIWGALHG